MCVSARTGRTHSPIDSSLTQSFIVVFANLYNVIMRLNKGARGFRHCLSRIRSVRFCVVQMVRVCTAHTLLARKMPEKWFSVYACKYTRATAFIRAD